MAKTFTVIKTNSRGGGTTETSGTIAELIETFSYTFECGESWQHEEGNAKINCNPRGIKSLVKNLNNAVNNSAADGWSNYSFSEA